MNTTKKTAVGAVLGGSLLVAGGLGLAHAAPPQAQSVVGDGTVNVTLTAGGQQIGVIQDVSLTNAETLATGVCPGDTNLQGLLKDIDAGQNPQIPPCTSTTGLSVTFAQNGTDSAEVAPGQNRPPAPQSSTSATATPAAPTTTTSR
jgi:hypothetical protein